MRQEEVVSVFFGNIHKGFGFDCRINILLILLFVTVVEIILLEPVLPGGRLTTAVVSECRHTAGRPQSAASAN